MEQNAVVLGDATDADVVALAEDPLEVAVHVFYVRGGQVRGQRGLIADKADDAPTGQLVERFLLQLYGENGEQAIPREILVPALPDDPDEAGALGELLVGLRGGRVDVRIPAAATSGHCWRPSPATRRRRWPCTRRSAPVI